MELLSAKHPGIPPTLRDDRLTEEVIKKHFLSCMSRMFTPKRNWFERRICLILFLQAEQLRQHYMTKYDSEVADAYQNLQPVLQNIKELKRKVSQKVKNLSCLHLRNMSSQSILMMQSVLKYRISIFARTCIST